MEPRLLLAYWPAESDIVVTPDGGAIEEGVIVAADAAGDFVVVWNSRGSDYICYARCYKASGEPRGEKFAISPIVDSFLKPSVAMDADGDFVVVYSGKTQTETGWFARRYDANGSAQGDPMFIGSGGSSRGQASVAMDQDGDFVVAWPGTDGTYARCFNAAETLLGPELEVHATPKGIPGFSFSTDKVSVKMEQDGDFLVCWRWLCDPMHVYYYGLGGAISSVTTYPGGLEYRRYDRAGTPLEPVQYWRSSYGYEWPRVVLGDDGAFALAYDNGCGGNTTFIDRFDSTGQRRGDTIWANGHFSHDTRLLWLDTDSSGNLLVLMDSYLREFDVTGHATSETSLARSPADRTAWNLEKSGIALAGNDSLFVAWAEPKLLANGKQDGLRTAGIRVRQYTRVADGGSISGSIWMDANGDGIRNDNEAPGKASEVNLYDSTGRLVNSMYPGPEGHYTFTGLPLNVPLYLEWSLGSGLCFTTPDAGADDAVDSDVDPRTRRVSFTLTSASRDIQVDAGISPTGTIDGVVYYDQNYNGVRDPDESGLAGRIVFLDANGDGQLNDNELRRTTDANGRYSFSSLLPIAYTVRLVTQDAWQVADPIALAMRPAQKQAGVDFGIWPLAPDTQVHAVGDALRLVPQESNRISAMATVPDPAGNLLVAWAADELDSRGGKIGQHVYVQKFDSAGNRLMQPIVVDGNSSAWYVCIAANSAGGFLAAWFSNSCINAQRFDAAGEPQGNRIVINDRSIDGVNIAAVAGGGSLVVWSSIARGSANPRVHAQLYDMEGNPQRQDTEIYSSTMAQQLPAIGVDSAGNHVITWLEGNWVCARRFDASGKALGEIIFVGAASQAGSAVAMSAGGSFAICWLKWPSYGDPTLSVQYYSEAGIPQGPSVTVSASSPSASIGSLRLIVDSYGNRTAVYKKGNAIYARRFNAAGLPQGPEFCVASGSAQYYWISAAIDQQGNIVVSWSEDAKSSTMRVCRYSMDGTILHGSSDPDTFYVTRSGDEVLVYRGDAPVGLPTARYAMPFLQRLVLEGGEGDDRLIVDCSGGNPIPPGGLSFVGGGGTDTVAIRGTTAENQLAVYDDRIRLDSSELAYGETEQVQLGTLPDSSTSDPCIRLGRLAIREHARVALVAGKRAITELGSLELSGDGTLDLSDGSLIVHTGATGRDAVLAQLADGIQSARGKASQAWGGPGLSTSAATANRQTGLAVMLNEKDGKAILSAFAGRSVDENDILVKYTWNGDVNLDGVVDAADYFLMDSGFITQAGGYRNGDLNYDGVVDAADYFLIDSAFITGNGVLATEATLSLVAEPVVPGAEWLQSQETPIVLQQLFGAKPLIVASRV